MELKEYADLLKNRSISEIHEWSINNILNTLSKKEQQGVSSTIISKIKITEQSELENDLTNAGEIFFKLKSFWTMNDGISHTSWSLFVFNIKSNTISNLAKKYRNISIIHEEIGDYGFDINRLIYSYSQINGNEMIFNGFQWVPTGMMSNLALTAHLKE